MMMMMPQPPENIRSCMVHTHTSRSSCGLNASGAASSRESPLLLGFTSDSICTTSRIVGLSTGKSLEQSSATLRTSITSWCTPIPHSSGHKKPREVYNAIDNIPARASPGYNTSIADVSPEYHPSITRVSPEYHPESGQGS
jgi:hypothetical protein